MNRSENSIDSLEKELAIIADTLKSRFSDVSLPEGLKSENFLKLLPDEPDKKVFDFKSILKINRLVPILSTVAAAALLITVVSRLGIGTLSPMKSEKATPAATAMQFTENAVEESAVAADLIEAPATEAEKATATGDSGEGAAEAVLRTSSSLELNEEAITDVSDITTGGMYEEEGVAVGGSAPATMLTKTDLHTFFWRSAIDDPDFSQYNAVLEVIDNQSNEVYIKVGLPEIYSVLNVVVGKDTVYVVGTTNTDLEILDFTGLTTGTLTHSGTYTVEGSVKNRYQQDGYLYIASTVSDGSVKVSVYDYAVENSTDVGVGIITVIDAGKSSIDMEYIDKIDPLKVYRNGSMFIFSSAVENDERLEVKATLNHGIVLFE